MDGNKLKKLRLERGYSLSRLSKVTDISKSYLSGMEQNTHINPSLEILERLAAAFGMKVEDLIKVEKRNPANTKNQTIKIKIEMEFPEIELDNEEMEQLKDFLLKHKSTQIQ